MTERPIILSAGEGLGLLSGTRTQLRRLVRPQPAGDLDLLSQPRCPYGEAGDRLWGKETMRYNPAPPFQLGQLVYAADGAEVPGARGSPHTIQANHMPRDRARILRTVVEVRLQRLQDISEDDAIAEGHVAEVRRWWQWLEYVDGLRGRHRTLMEGGNPDAPPDPAWILPQIQELRIGAREDFIARWGSDHRNPAWVANPYTWVITLGPAEPGAGSP